MELLKGSNHESAEIANDLKVILPIGADLFFVSGDQEAHLPQEIAKNPRLLAEASKRRALYTQLSGVFDRVSDMRMDIDNAIVSDLIGQEEVASLYINIVDFLETDSNNVRLLLYLPFELLPNMKIQVSYPGQMLDARQRFSDVYVEGWIRLLHELEPRASFVDGDVLEPGLPEPEIISKAGHLSHELLAKGIISAGDIIALLDIIPDAKLIKSLAEGATVAKDKGLIDDMDWERMSVIIERRLQNKLGAITYSEDDLGTVSLERIAWLKKMREEVKINEQVEHFSENIQQVGLSAIDSNVPYSDTQYWRVAIIGLFKALTNGVEFSEDAKVLLQDLWEVNQPEIRTSIIGGVNRLVHMGIVEKEFAGALGVRVVDLSVPLPVSIDAITEDCGQFLDTVKKIRGDQQLSQVMYPALLMFGSRIKGYAEANADYDVAIFLKPEAKFTDRARILERLREVAPEIASVDKILEYWMQEHDGKVGFRFSGREDDPLLAGEQQVHFFLGGAWIVQGDEYRRMCQDILHDYLDLSRYGEQKDVALSKFLGRIELDILQYRLMHKGYRRLYQAIKQESIEHSSLIDWESDFWDSGYRRVATKLFLSRVFLPDLS